MSDHELLNPGPYPVEVHLPDRVERLGPGESTKVGAADQIGGQADELVRRGLLELRPVPATRTRKPRKSAARKENPSNESTAGRPTRRTGRTRGGA